MDVFDTIKNRRSIRKYSIKPIEDEKLNRIIEAGRLAPSARNLQNWKFIIVRDEKIRSLVTQATGQSFVGTAPVILAVCGTDAEGVMKCGQYRHTVDLSIALSFMMLQAQEEGLGTCWLGSYDEKKVKDVLFIPDDVRVVAITPLGYPDENPSQRPRKSIDEIVCYEKYC